jgi:hypothetical protein
MSIFNSFIITPANYIHDFITGGPKPICGTTETIEARRIRAIWQPELVQDLQAFQNIDEVELTNLLVENISNEIDRQILRDLHDNQRFYQQNNFNNALDRWNQIGGDVLMHHGHREPHQYFTDQDYSVLPNEEGWFTNGTFESLMIKMDMLPFRFILPRNRRRRRV